MKATRVVLVVALLGCGDRVPTSVTPRAAGFDQPSLVADSGLVRCTPLSPDSISRVPNTASASSTTTMTGPSARIVIRIRIC